MMRASSPLMVYVRNHCVVHPEEHMPALNQRMKPASNRFVRQAVILTESNSIPRKVMLSTGGELALFSIEPRPKSLC